MIFTKTRTFKFICLMLTSCLASASLLSSEGFDSTRESPTLANITQLTFPSMGFEKAGEAYFSPDSQTIIFQAVPKGQEHYQIYTMHLKEGIPRMVSTGKGACTCANFRPDGKKIIFASSHEDPLLQGSFFETSVPGYQREGSKYSWAFTPYMNVYEANPDGTDLVALTTGSDYHAECAYSSDGKQIVFAGNADGSMNLYIMNSDGTDIRNVTNTSQGYNGGPFFSPDNKRIIFRADYERPDLLQIYRIDTDGSNLVQLTHGRDVNWAPYWHPNGRVIAYTTSKHGHSQYEIYLLNIDTGASSRVTYNSTFDGLPVFNNDGSRLMWTSKRGPDNTSQIFIAEFTLPHELN